MSCTASYYSQTGVSPQEVILYLKSKYGIKNVVDLCAEHNGYYDYKDCYCLEGFGKNNRTLHIFTQHYEDEDGYNEPAPIIIGQSFFVSFASNRESIEVLTDLARHFGGYVCENDCAEPSSINYWKKYPVPSKIKSTKDEIVNRQICALLQNSTLANKDKKMITAFDFDDFIKNNFNKISKIIEQ